MIFNPQDNLYMYYNKEMCEKETSPYSTFKIVSTLMGLNNHVIDNELSTLNYSGAKYPIPEWNNDLTLKEAFGTSCIWYFRKIIDNVGKDEVQKELSSLQYGNCDISEWSGSGLNGSEDLDGFWLDSSLQISPNEQINVLIEIFEGKSEYTIEDISILKSIMLVYDEEQRKIYGKTGSGTNGQAWFVGFSEENEEKEYFAIYLDDTDDISKPMNF